MNWHSLHFVPRFETVKQYEAGEAQEGTDQVSLQAQSLTYSSPNPCFWIGLKNWVNASQFSSSCLTQRWGRGILIPSYYPSMSQAPLKNWVLGQKAAGSQEGPEQAARMRRQA